MVLMRHLLLVAMLTLIVPSSVQAGSALTGEEIESNVIGGIFKYRGWENGQRREGRVAYERGGRVYIITKEGYVDHGTWEIVGPQLCTRIAVGRGGRQVCFTLDTNGDGTYTSSHRYRLTPLTSLR